MEPTKRRLTGQLRTVLAYLIGHGTTTNREAMLSLGVGRLASRISELRALGVLIRNACPEAGKRYAAYSLGDKAAARALLTGGGPPDVAAAEIIGGAPPPPNKCVCDEGVSPVHSTVRDTAPQCVCGAAGGGGGNG